MFIEKSKLKASFKKGIIFFTIGGVGYTAIELLWRGRTHWSMAVAGGICATLMSDIAARFATRPLVYKAALSALTITAVELAFGVIFNILLDMRVWDYSGNRFNLLGQICPLFTFIWWGLSLMFLPFAQMINKRIDRNTDIGAC